jgi:hypothetical protein
MWKALEIQDFKNFNLNYVLVFIMNQKYKQN